MWSNVMSENLYNDQAELLAKQEKESKDLMNRMKANKEETMFDGVDKQVHLVTGGLGHIGSYIVEFLVSTRNNCKVIVVDNLYNGKYENLKMANMIATAKINQIIVENVDISDSKALDKVFQKYKPQFVYHQASTLTLDSKIHRRLAVDTNILGFVNVLENCLASDAKKLVYASSASVFGDPNNVPTREQESFKNCSLLYGATKVCNEYLAKSYSEECGLKFVGLRYFNGYGYRQSTNNVYTQIVPKWINAFIDEKPIVIYGDGEQTMDMIHGRDVGKINVYAMRKMLWRGIKYEADNYEGNHRRYAVGSKKRYQMQNLYFDGFINIGSGIQTSVKELYSIIKVTLEEKGIDTSKSEIIYEDHDPALVKKRQCDNTLMRKLLTKDLLVDVKTGIETTVRNILKEREGEKRI